MILFWRIKKKTKKRISSLLPKGVFKDRIKLLYYKIFSPSGVQFALEQINGKVVFVTTIQDIELRTNYPLYNLVKDFAYYQHFYNVKKDDVVIDAGANVGVLSLYFSKKVGDSGSVFSFEPDRYNITEINNNIELNPGTQKNIKIQNQLLWNTNTLVDFQESGTVGSSAVWFSGNENIVKKQAVTIDSWVNDSKIERLDYIKMDIEGAEIEALEGCIETIKKYQPKFAIASYHIVNNEPTYLQLERFFESIEYPFKTVFFDNHEIITFAGFKG
jgi:FkbM family methyltransferase